MVIFPDNNLFIRQMNENSLYSRRPHYLSTTIIENMIIDEVLVMFQMSRIVELAGMRSTFRIFIFNIKTDTVVIQVAKTFTVVQVVDGYVVYRVVH